MIKRTSSSEEIEKFLKELIPSNLALLIFQQLEEDGGNTIQGISVNLKEKGYKASKTMVYEEIKLLLELNLVKNISKRPPIYTTDTSKENLERLAKRFMDQSQSEMLRRWAVSYPFLSEEITESGLKGQTIAGAPMVNFNPYPIVQIYNVETDDLRKYLLQVFNAKELNIVNTLIDVCLSGENYHKAFAKSNFQELLNQLKSNKERFGNIKLKTISTYYSSDLKALMQTDSMPEFYKTFFNFIDYELRETEDKISSFVIADDIVLYPIGLGKINQKTFAVIEIQDKEIVQKAKKTFNEIWERAKVIFKIEEGVIYKE
ncbi:MAG: hypothetical protein FK734_10000 [Asgard group archaeon]|nr:hypothetical protein [Asgard group archaeon]